MFHDEQMWCEKDCGEKYCLNEKLCALENRLCWYGKTSDHHQFHWFSREIQLVMPRNRAVTFFRVKIFTRGLFCRTNIGLKLLKTPKNMLQLQLSAELAY